MAQENMYNPFLFWKKMYETTEKNVSKAMDETLRTEEYAEFLGNVQTAYLQYQDMIQRTTDTYLNQLNIPTRDEISSIASLIINVEEKVEDLTETLEDEEDQNETLQSEITNIKRTVARVERKLNLVLDEMKEEETPAEKSEPKDKDK